MASTRQLLNKLTKAELIKLGKKYGIKLCVSHTKTGMGSRLMRTLTALQIRKELS